MCIRDSLGTEAGAATDTQGCSNEQNKKQSVEDSSEGEGSSGMKFMMTLIIIGIIVLLGAGTILLTKKKEEDGDTSEIDINAPEVADAKSWDMPVLDGTTPVDEQDGPDMSKFSGWSKEQVQNYLDSGWTEEQLAEWYNQQIDDNSAQD